MLTEYLIARFSLPMAPAAVIDAGRIRVFTHVAPAPTVGHNTGRLPEDDLPVTTG